MLDFLTTASTNLLSPMILSFALGLFAAAIRSDLHVPETASKVIGMYLMFAIGFKGGVEMAKSALDMQVFGSALAGLAMSFAMPVLAFGLLQVMTTLDRKNAAALAAHYGSISIVTFVTATQFLVSRDIGYEPHLVAVMALMETPAIITGLLLARQGLGNQGHVFREVFTNSSIMLLVGGFAIGYLTGNEGMALIKPFVADLFNGIVCFFLLDMGLTAARKFEGLKTITPGLLGFGILMPLIGAVIGAGAGLIVGLSPGGTFLLAILGASASYIAVPAAMQVAMPEAKPSIYITLCLAVTFPFNIVIGIPLYFSTIAGL